MKDDTSGELTPQEIQQAVEEYRSAIVNDDVLFLEDVDGRREYLCFEDDRAKLIVYKDTTALEEANKRAYNEPINHKSEFRRIASFDPAFLDIYGFQRGLPNLWYYQKEYGPELMTLAHDPDYRNFRTMPGEFRKRV